MISRWYILCIMSLFCFASSLNPFIVRRSQKSVRPRFIKSDQALFLISLTAGALIEYAIQKNNLSFETIRPAIQKLISCLDIPTAKQVEHEWNENYLTNTQVAAHDTLRIPQELQSLKNFEFHQMRSTRQDGGSCAWYSAFNAKAIQDIVSRREPLTAAKINERVCTQLIPLVKQKEASFKKVLGTLGILCGLHAHQTHLLAKQLCVKNYYDIWKLPDGVMVSCDDSHSRFKNAPYLAQHKKYIFGKIEPVVKEIKQKSNALSSPTHMLLSVPSTDTASHTVLLTVINRGKKKKPLLLYLNSNNTNLLASQLVPASVHVENKHIIQCVTALNNA